MFRSFRPIIGIPSCPVNFVWGWQCRNRRMTLIAFSASGYSYDDHDVMVTTAVTQMHLQRLSD